MYLTKKTTKIILCIILSFCSSLFVIFGSNALAQNTSSPFYWDYINVNIDVQNNGDMLITETQKYVFTKPHSNQRYHYIPLNKVDRITDIAVFEDNQQLPINTGIKNNQMWISWEHSLNPPEEHTFELTYRVIGGLHIYEQGDQVYWKAIFPDRSASIQKSTVTVKLPESLSNKIVSFKNFGVPASSEQIDSRIIRYISNQPLQPKQELEVQVIFPHGIIKTQLSSWQTREQTNLSESKEKTKRLKRSSIYFLIGLIFTFIGYGLMFKTIKKPIFIEPGARVKILIGKNSLYLEFDKKNLKIYILSYLGSSALAFTFLGNGLNVFESILVGLVCGLLISFIVFGIVLYDREIFLRRNYHCSHCRHKMEELKLSQFADYLTRPQQVANQLGSLKIKGWQCPNCSQNSNNKGIYILIYEVLFNKYHKCPNCKEETFSRTERILKEATHYRTGKMLITNWCYCCFSCQEVEETIPEISSGGALGR